MFDYNMMLLDGSVNLTPNTDTPADSIDRDGTSKAAVIDLGAGGTPAGGLSCVLILPQAVLDSDTLVAVLEVSMEANFGNAVYKLHELGKFDVGAGTLGTILDTETPAVVILRFATKQRYVRFNGTVSAGGNFGAVKCFLTPYAFHIL